LSSVWPSVLPSALPSTLPLASGVLSSGMSPSFRLVRAVARLA
jgi:hypothetical protein